jgi:hypothetical protein
VLGAAHGWLVVSFDGERRSVLDLDTGKAETVTYVPYGPDGLRADLRAPIVLADRLVYTAFDAGVSSVRSVRAGDEPPTLVIDHASILTPSSIPGRFWVALDTDQKSTDQNSNAHKVAEIDQDGRVASTVSIPDGLRVVGAGATGLWLAGSGRIYSLTRGGLLQAIAVGVVVDASVSGVLFDDCAIAGACSLRFASPTPTLATLPLVGPSSEIHPATTIEPTDPAMSPDGRYLLLSDGLLDRRTGGRTAHPFILQAWRWSPDGQWLFVWTAHYETIAWNLVDGRQINLGNTNGLSGVVSR